MKTIKVVGVPEHFNLPWHMCIENGEFEVVGLDVNWTNVPEGTGKMCEMLKNNETDIAVILTEGIIKDMAFGNSAIIVQEYVKSPLNWGVHVDYLSNYENINQLENKKVAISRFGSGSHLMSVVHAKTQNWEIENMEFEIVNTINGAVEALSDKKADYFMWEKFMTQPLVNNKTFKRIGEFPTPWPCFVIAVKTEFYINNKQSIALLLEILNATTSEFKIIPSIDRTLASKYTIPLPDIQLWLQQTEWSQKNISEKTFNLVQKELKSLQLIPNLIDFNNYVK